MIGVGRQSCKYGSNVGRQVHLGPRVCHVWKPISLQRAFQGTNRWIYFVQFRSKAVHSSVKYVCDVNLKTGRGSNLSEQNYRSKVNTTKKWRNCLSSKILLCIFRVHEDWWILAVIKRGFSGSIPKKAAIRTQCLAASLLNCCDFVPRSKSC